MGAVSIIVVLAVGGPMLTGSQRPTASIPVHRQPASASLTLREMWRTNDLQLPSYTRSALLCGHQAVVFLDQRRNELTALNPADGTVAWRINTADRPRALSMTPSYVLSLHGGRIHAFSPEDGDPIWTSTDSLPERMTYRLEPVGDRLRVYSNEQATTGRQQVIRVFDINNGVLIDTYRMPDSGTAQVELRMTDVDLWEDGKTLWAVSRNSESTLWRYEIPGPVDSWPIAGDSQVIVAAGLPSDLRAIDIGTGRNVWSYIGGIVSNPIAYSGRVYALQEDATLVELDQETGKVLGELRFSPSLQDQPGTISAYWIAVCDGTLYLYFGDIGELFAFSLESVE
jgi:outer membrane protein assembly factor BamB